MLDELSEDAKIRRMDPGRVLCQGNRRFFYDDGEVLYSDSNHLSIDGAARLVLQMRWALSGRISEPPDRS